MASGSSSFTPFTMQQSMTCALGEEPEDKANSSLWSKASNYQKLTDLRSSRTHKHMQRPFQLPSI